MSPEPFHGTLLGAHQAGEGNERHRLGQEAGGEASQGAGRHPREEHDPAHEGAGPLLVTVPLLLSSACCSCCVKTTFRLIVLAEIGLLFIFCFPSI